MFLVPIATHICVCTDAYLRLLKICLTLANKPEVVVITVGHREVPFLVMLFLVAITNVLHELEMCSAKDNS